MLRCHSPKRLVLLLLSCVVAAVLPLVSSALGPHHAPKDAKQQISELEQQWRTAALNSDTSAMDRLLSEDYVGISWTGQVNNKSSQLDRLRSREFAITRMDLSDLKIKVVGSVVAIVTSRAEVEGTNEGAPINGEFRYTRVYQRLSPGVWKITHFEATRMVRGNHHNRPGQEPRSPSTSGTQPE